MNDNIASQNNQVAPRCPKCDGEMELGFVQDVGHHGIIALQRWVQGLPERSIFFGLIKTANKKNFDVCAIRCSACGFLEFYAGR